MSQKPAYNRPHPFAINETGDDQLTFVAPPLVNLRRSFAARAFIETEPSGVIAGEAVSLLAH
jgi:hypothetical protein